MGTQIIVFICAAAEAAFIDQDTVNSGHRNRLKRCFLKILAWLFLYYILASILFTESFALFIPTHWFLAFLTPLFLLPSMCHVSCVFFVTISPFDVFNTCRCKRTKATANQKDEILLHVSPLHCSPPGTKSGDKCGGNSIRLHSLR